MYTKNPTFDNDIEFFDAVENIVNAATCVADEFDDETLVYSYADDEDFIACKKDLADIFTY